jgi:hypothetical protein
VLTRISSVVVAAGCALAVAGSVSSVPALTPSRVHVMVAGVHRAPVPVPAVPVPPAPVPPARPTTSKYVATPGSRGVKVQSRRIEPKAVPAHSSWRALNRALASIPGYRSGVARWAITNRFGHWGTTDLSSGRIYISPSTPAAKLYSVAAHEYAHVLTSAAYGWHWQAMSMAMDRWYGGGPLIARERAADCMARAMGATWTNYTACSNAHWLTGARTLLAGRRLH